MILNQRAIIEQNEARQVLLRNVIERYLTLSTEEEEEFQLLVNRPEYAEAKQMISVYEERGIEIGVRRGIEQGLVLGMRRMVFRQMNARFGEIPPEVAARVEAIESQPELEALLDRVIAAPTLEAVGLN